jgi:hypothetical protein
MQVGGEITRGARTKQDHRQVARQGVCSSLGTAILAEDAAQRHALGIGKHHCLGVQAEVGRHLVAVPIRKKNERIQ